MSKIIRSSQLKHCAFRFPKLRVANTVGYTHLDYFAVAFKKKFGISLKAWQQGEKLIS